MSRPTNTLQRPREFQVAVRFLQYTAASWKIETVDLITEFKLKRLTTCKLVRFIEEEIPTLKPSVSFVSGVLCSPWPDPLTIIGFTLERFLLLLSA